jgi:hypothetical protein
MRLTWPLKAYVLDFNAPMNVTLNMDNFAKKRKKKLVVDILFKFPNLLRTSGSLRLSKPLKLMAQKENQAALHHKKLEPKYIPRQECQIWVIIPTQKENQTYNSQCWK